jgi:hypothetical protein
MVRTSTHGHTGSGIALCPANLIAKTKSGRDGQVGAVLKAGTDTVKLCIGSGQHPIVKLDRELGRYDYDKPENSSGKSKKLHGGWSVTTTG